MQRPRDPAAFTADFLQLLTRIFATVMLAVIALVYLARHEYIPMAFFGSISLVVQRFAVKLYRKLRDERAAFLAERNDLTTTVLEPNSASKESVENEVSKDA